jgi:hypothetical protein
MDTERRIKMLPVVRRIQLPMLAAAFGKWRMHAASAIDALARIFARGLTPTQVITVRNNLARMGCYGGHMRSGRGGGLTWKVFNKLAAEAIGASLRRIAERAALLAVQAAAAHALAQAASGGGRFGVGTVAAPVAGPALGPVLRPGVAAQVPAGPSLALRVLLFWIRLQMGARRLASSAVLDKATVVGIVSGIILLAAEHDRGSVPGRAWSSDKAYLAYHGGLDAANLSLNILFVMELSLKLSVFGLRYLTGPFELLDVLVVGVGVYESPSLFEEMQCKFRAAGDLGDCFSSGVGVSVLRALRMLRFGRLLGKYPVIQARSAAQSLLCSTNHPLL